MSKDSSMLRIIREIEKGAPPPIRITRLLESPPQVYFSLVYPAFPSSWWDGFLASLGQQSVNIRFLNQISAESGIRRAGLCVDAQAGNRVTHVLARMDGSRRTALPSPEEVPPARAARILSAYLFKGQPWFAAAILAALEERGVEPLSAGAASSVLSVVVEEPMLEAARAALADLS